MRGLIRSLSVVIPAFNEERRLPATLQAAVAYLRHRNLPFSEIVVVDDGSCDRTAELVREFGHLHPFVKLLQNPGNRGKGYAVRNGMLNAGGEWLLFTDADLSTPLEELAKLEEAAGDAQVVIGSRALNRALIGVRQPWLREFSGRLFNLVVRLVTGLPFSDTQCGFKLYRRTAAQQVFPRQKLDGFSFDVEDLVIARGLGFRIVEVPVRWNNAEGTKVSALSGLRSFGDLVGIRRNAARGWYK